MFVSGGVAANAELRATFEREAARRASSVFFPSRELSTDNAAMIAAAAYPKLRAGALADVYALLEVAIAAFGLLVLWGLPYAGGLYFAIAVHGMSGVLLRGLFCAICLLPPTLLMGATLPAISRWVETTPEGVSWLGFFYGGNIAGAVFGCLLAGFYLLRVHDMASRRTSRWRSTSSSALAQLSRSRSVTLYVAEPDERRRAEHR